MTHVDGDRRGRRREPAEPDLEIEGPSPTRTGTSPDESFDDFYHREFGNIVALGFVLAGRRATVDLAEDAFTRTRRRWQDLERPEVFVRRSVSAAAISWPSRLAATARARLRTNRAAIGPVEPADDALWAAVRHLGGRRAQVAALYLLEERSVDEIPEIHPGAFDQPIARSPLSSSAAVRLRRAADIPPPPLRRTTTATRLLQIGVVVLVAVLVVAASVTDTSGGHRPTTPAPITAAVTEAATTRFVQNLAGGHYRAAHRQLAPTVAPIVDPLVLQVQWENVVRAFGAFKSTGPTEVSAVGNSPTLSVTAVITLVRGQVSIGIVFTAAGQIQGFGFLSHPAPGGQTPATQTLFDRAATIIQMLAAGSYQSVIDGQNRLSAASADPDVLRQRWEQVDRAYGAFESVGMPTISEADEFSVNQPVNWARGQSIVIVAFDSVGDLDHLVFLRADSPPAALSAGAYSSDGGAEALAAGAGIDLRDGKYADLAGRFDSVGGPSAGAERLRQQWQAVTASLGARASPGQACPARCQPGQRRLRDRSHTGSRKGAHPGVG